MILDKYTQMSYFEIWHPRYHDQRVLLAKRKVGKHNKIVFTKAPTLGDKPYYISGAKIKRFKIENNGKIDCYAVPLDELEPLEYTVNSIHNLY